MLLLFVCFWFCLLILFPFTGLNLVTVSTYVHACVPASTSATSLIFTCVSISVGVFMFDCFFLSIFPYAAASVFV